MESPQGAHRPAPVELRRLLPAELLERDIRHPFDPPPGLAGRHASGAVQPVTLGNGREAWLVSGFTEARQVLGDVRFSSDRVRYPDAAEQRPGERAVAERTDGMFLTMCPG